MAARPSQGRAGHAALVVWAHALAVAAIGALSATLTAAALGVARLAGLA